LFLVVIFGALPLVVFTVCFRDLALGDLMGEIRVNPLWVLLPLIPLLNP
jgi:hypothetical protein